MILSIFTLVANIFAAIPILEKYVNMFIVAWGQAQSDKQKALIDKAVKSSQDAVTSEDVKKAAHEAAEATRNL